MELLRSLTLVWALSGTAGALQCQTCTNLQCSSTVSLTCASETSCVTASIQASLAGVSLQQIFKACAPSSLCPAPGSQTFSGNFGATSALASVQCCNTDNCNSANLPFPAAETANSLRCFTCDPVTSQCTTQLQCTGSQDRCVQASLTSGSTTTPFLGCASVNLCSAAAGLLGLPPLQTLGNITSGPTCCETSLCNGMATPPPAAPTTNAAPTVAATATSEACCVRLALIHLLLGLFVFTLC